MKTGPKRIPLEIRFWMKVDTTGGLSACWPFVGANTKGSIEDFEFAAGFQSLPEIAGRKV